MDIRKLLGLDKSKKTAWTILGDVPISSSRMWIGDAMLAPIPEDGEVVDVPEGTYEVSVFWIDTAYGEREAILRAVLKGEQAERGKRIGETWADTASQAVCDFEAYSDAVGDDHDAYQEAAALAMFAERPGLYTLAPDAILAHCSSGPGDGTFPLYEMVSGGRRVGIELDFYEDA